MSIVKKYMAESVAGNGSTRMYSEESSINKRIFSVQQRDNPELNKYASGTNLLCKLYKDSPEQLGSLIVNLGRQAARLHVDKFIKDEKRSIRGENSSPCTTVVVWSERGIS